MKASIIKTKRMTDVQAYNVFIIGTMTLYLAKINGFNAVGV